MKMYKYRALSVSANADPYIVFNNLYKEYHNIEYFNPFNNNFYGRKDDPFKHPLDGIKINNIFSGSTKINLDGKECYVELDTNIELYSERSILIVEFEFTINEKESFEKFYTNLNENFLSEKNFSWKKGNDTIECSILSIINNF